MHKALSAREKRDSTNDLKTMRWLYQHTKGVGLRILFLTGSSAIGALLSIGFALGMKELIDSATRANKNALIINAAFVFGLMLARMILSVGTSAVSLTTAVKLKINIQTNSLDALYHKDYAHIAAFHSGELLNRLFSDVAVIVNGIMGFLPSVAGLLFQLAGAAAALLLLAPEFTLICILIGIGMCSVMLFFRGRFKALHKHVQEALGRLRSFMQETVSGLLVIKVFEAADQIEQKTDQYQKEYFAAQMKRRGIGIIANTGLGLVFQLSYFAALLWGCMEIYLGTMTYGTLTAMLQLVGQVQSPFSGVSGLISQMYGVLASAERIMEMEAWPDEQQQEFRSREEQYEQFTSLSFEHVNFTYGRTPVLEDVSLRISKGDIAAFTGFSGGGKSTMFLLMLGAYHPTDGNVWIEYEDSRQMPDIGTRRLLAYVPQGHHLFSGTISENLTFFKEDVPEDQINVALETACAKAFINELPDGLNTVIGEKGQGLSEGQMQRIAIARALLSGAPVLLLDEATSALDEETEARLLANIAGLKNRTCLIVTHRPAALRICNRHFQLKDGKISEYMC